ncbi:U3 small nucleolar RNA-associated protein 25 homolog [Anastrepha ludens]|uniref:U3 small nucleolar RNA-associated protein 25 homolog n=1 Tax=Anastrepha ludens TaxID=28586 RepID=UPI0023B0019F|nr:U3 small nucleolar RNA-associated protein 25 homolog [Anastrepha ludens]
MRPKKKPIRKERNTNLNKVSKNLKFKRKAKEMMEQHRKQALLEKSYRENEETKIDNVEGKILEFIKDEFKNENEQENTFDELMDTLSTNEKKNMPANDLYDEESDDDESVNAAEADPVEEDTIEENAAEVEELEPVQADDIFAMHFDFDLPLECIDNLWSAQANVEKKIFTWPNLGIIKIQIPHLECQEQPANTLEWSSTCKQLNTESLKTIGIRATILDNFSREVTPLQLEVFQILNHYKDFCYPNVPKDQIDNLRFCYSAHVLNHMLKTRNRILKHSMKLASTPNLVTIPDSYRDQGLARPKVLIIIPFRKCAYQIVTNMGLLMYGKNMDGKIMNYARFTDEYTGDSLRFPKNKPKPEDYMETFKGNIDDNFKIGISLTKKNLKLYTDFNASDIIIASPLGLRLGMASNNNEAGAFDFLNSVEILVLDKTEMFLAQNWENLLHVVDHLHLQPQSLSNVNLQRVRPWCLNGLCRFYRQTIVLSSHELPEIRSLFSNKCVNYSGRVSISNPVLQGDINNVFVTIPQIFHLIDTTSLDSVFDSRFRYFVKEILPRYRNPSFAHCMIYVPSYFDYVRLRNYMKAESISFAQICEYTKKEKVARARDMFFHSGVHFLLYSERYHFYQRTRIKGIRHLIMYQPPMWPQLYSEMVNMMNDSNQNSADALDDSMSITVLYSKYDIIQLNAILGTESAAELQNSNKTTHSFTIK